MRLPTRLLRRKLDSSKGDFGHVLVLAGSLRYSGAALLCAEAALRSGAGLVTIGVPKGIAVPLIRSKLREIMVLPLPQTRSLSLHFSALKEVSAFMRTADVLAIGPGLTKDPSTVRLVQAVVAQVDKPTVLDADGLNAYSGITARLNKPNGELVVTPHPGEMARLLGISCARVQARRIVIAKKFAKDYNCITVLKGHRSVVADPQGGVYVNTSGNPGMATAGSGDVLTGIIAGFLAQGVQAADAAKFAVFVHGVAGDLAAEKKTQISLIASDIIDTIHTAIRKAS